jgi:hypothetical protein
MVVLAKNTKPGEGYIMKGSSGSEDDYVIIAGKEDEVEKSIPIYMPLSPEQYKVISIYNLNPNAKLLVPEKSEDMQLFIKIAFEAKREK